MNERLLLFLLCVVCDIISVVSDACDTPRKQTGECIPIKSCPPLLQLLQHKPVSQENIDFLRESQCGFEGNQPKVCCPMDNPGQPASGNSNSNLLPGSDVCGPDPHERILGGKKAGLQEFPWMALLEYEKPTGRGFHCGGSLINKRYILTAAHCVQRIPKTWKLVGVRLGEYDLDKDVDCDDSRPGFENCAEPPVNIPVEEIIVHEQYIPLATSQTHDIALLRLSRDAPYTEYIHPVCLPTNPERQNIEYRGSMVVAGWGRTENRSQSNIKLKLQVPLKSNSECASTYSRAKVQLGDGQVCAGGILGEDSCAGDSGGPLMFLNKRPPEYNWYLTGVVSFGPTPCGLKNWPGVYTKVERYVPWVINKLKP